MKVRYLIAISIILILLGYLVGQFIPWDLLHPNIVDRQITMNDFYTRMISIVGALATIFATIVALFKEDIRKTYEYASLTIDFKHSDKISEILDSTDSSEGDSTFSATNLSAKKYELIAVVCNTGKLAAKNCQVYLEHLSYKNSNYPQPKEFPTSGKPLPWIAKSESSTIIPSTAKTFISILEILSPQSETVDPSKLNVSQNPQIRIAGIDIGSQNLSANYFCTFMIYSENANPVQFKLEIIWNGKWEQRLSEMKNCIEIKKVNK